MLNFKNDPLLLEKETINALIRNKNNQFIFLEEENHFLNLFSAFVKKDDFVKKDKITQPLQKTAYGKISLNLTNEIKQRFSDKEIIHLFEEYFGRRSNLIHAVPKWKETKTFPLVILRLLSANNTELSRFLNEVEYYTDFLKKSRFYSPKNLNELLNSQLVYLAGCSIGDGNIDGAGKRWTLVEGSSKRERLLLSRKFISNISGLLRNYVNHYEVKEYETKYTIRINNKLFCRFMNFFFNHPFGKKKRAILEKPLILNFSNQDLEKYFWRGCFDTDGSVNVNGVVDFCSSDKNLLIQCLNYLEKKGIGARKSGNLIVIDTPSLKNFADIGFSHPRKQVQFLDRLRKGTKLLNIKIKYSGEINKALLEIYPYLRFDQNGYGIQIQRKILNKYRKRHLKHIINKLFGCQLRETTQNRLYFKSKKANNYLKSKFIIEPYWKPINKNEEIELLNRWNKIWS